MRARFDGGGTRRFEDAAVQVVQFRRANDGHIEDGPLASEDADAGSANPDRRRIARQFLKRRPDRVDVIIICHLKGQVRKRRDVYSPDIKAIVQFCPQPFDNLRVMRIEQRNDSLHSAIQCIQSPIVFA